jgi:hypothetical protein
MKKILLILLAALSVYGTQQSLTGFKGATLGATDTVIASGNFLVDSSVSIGALWLPAGTAYTLSNTGTNVVTLANSGDAWKDSTTGTKTYPRGIILNGASGVFKIAGTSGAITATSCALTMNTTTAGAIVINKASITFGPLIINGSVEYSGTGASCTFAADTRALTMENGSKLNITGASFLIAVTGSGRSFCLGTNDTITGTKTISRIISGNGLIDTLSKIFWTSTGSITLNNGIPSTQNSIYMTDTLNAATGAVTSAGGSSGIIFLTNNFPVYASQFLVYSNSTGTSLVKLGSATHAFGSFDVSLANATTTDSLQGCTINLSGNMTLSATSVFVAGTSTVNVTNTSTVTTANKHFWNLVCNGATKVITFVNRLVCENNFTITAGKPAMASAALDTVATDWVNNLTSTDTCNFNNDSLNLGGSYTGNLRVKNHLRTNLYGTALCNFTSNGSIPNRIVINGTDRTKQMKLIDRYHSKYLTVTTGNLNTNGMDCFADSAIVITDSVATVLGDTISSSRVTFGASAKPDLVNPMLLYFGLALTDTLFDTCARNIGNVFINKSAGTIWQTVGVTHLTNLTVNGGKAILGSSTTDTVYCVDFFANNYGAGDSIILNAPLVISGNLAANVKWGGASKIILAGNTVISAGGGRFPPIQTLVPRVITTSDSINFQKWTFADSTEMQLSSSVGVKVDTIGDISGSAGKLIYFFASTPGTRARLYGPLATVSYTKWTDIAYSVIINAPISTNIDGGNNTGISWSTGVGRKTFTFYKQED